MKKHVNIPIFIPHLGCPNQCVFCNQRKITGIDSFSPDSVKMQIENALATVSPETDAEIAFFGGSFTGIDRELMCRLLEIAHSFVEKGRVSSIRCSTRPDYISEEILDILAQYKVSVIELGLQSADDNVLFKTKRGHDFECEIKACKMIVERGFSLVGQMMIGLPGSTPENEEKTAKFIISSGASAARIYPTVVFRDTELCEMANSGGYTPITEEEAILRSARVLGLFRDSGVKVIRIGLCASENLSDAQSYHSGPNHPALGELVENEYYFNKIVEAIDKLMVKKGDCLNIAVSSGALSKAIGQKKRNKLRLISHFDLSDVRFLEKSDVDEFTVEVTVGERKY